MVVWQLGIKVKNHVGWSQRLAKMVLMMVPGKEVAGGKRLAKGVFLEEGESLDLSHQNIIEARDRSRTTEGTAFNLILVEIRE